MPKSFESPHVFPAYSGLSSSILAHLLPGQGSVAQGSAFLTKVPSVAKATVARVAVLGLSGGPPSPAQSPSLIPALTSKQARELSPGLGQDRTCPPWSGEGCRDAVAQARVWKPFPWGVWVSRFSPVGLSVCGPSLRRNGKERRKEHIAIHRFPFLFLLSGRDAFDLCPGNAENNSIAGTFLGLCVHTHSI